MKFPPLLKRWLCRIGRLSEEDWLFILHRDRARVVSRSGIPYFPVAEALAFIDACDEADLAVLGFDGFDVDPRDRSLSPRMDVIVDSSSIEAADWREFRAEANGFAREVLYSLTNQPNLAIEFVLWSEAERAATSRGAVEIDVGTGRPLRIDAKMLKLLPRRGWTSDSVAETVRTPARVEPTVDGTRRPR